MNLFTAIEKEAHGGATWSKATRPSRIKPKRRARNAGLRRLNEGSSRTSMGGPQHQPASKKDWVRIAQPEKISQKIGDAADRTAEIIPNQTAGYPTEVGTLVGPLKVSLTL